MATELAKAYVQIIPTAQGIKGNLEDLLGDELAAEGKKGGHGFASRFAEAARDGIASAARVAGGIAKEAIESYADYEQLAGGIETLFGAGGQSMAQYAASQGKSIAEIEGEYNNLMIAQERMMQNASKAYATAGMSANEYMETAIQSAAALINSLGGDQAAASKLMDMSITDMADNVNKMGTTMEAVQNAYRGFSRGNFTMLDNLALGFAGTKEGMQELLDKAQEFSGVKYDIGSYADIVNAIHVVQDEMGITGTTQKEAAETISGSLSSLKASWQNLLTGLASGNADLSGLTGQLVASAKTFGKNLLPVAKDALKGLATVVKELAPDIAAELPELVSDLAPDLGAAAVGIAVVLGTSLAENSPQIVTSLLSAITANAPALLQGGVQMVISLISGLIQAAPQLLLEAGKLVLVILAEVGKGAVELLTAGGELVAGLWNGIAGAAGWLWDKISGWLSSIWEGIKEFFGVASPSKEMAWMGGMLSEGLAEGITASAGDAVNAATRMSADVLSAMNGGDYALTASAATGVEFRHTGTIRVEGVNSKGELVAVTDIIYDNIVAKLQREVRYA